MLPCFVQGHGRWTGGQGENGAPAVARVESRFRYLGHVVLAGGEVEHESVVYGEGFVGSPGGVGGSAASRDDPARGITDHVSGLGC